MSLYDGVDIDGVPMQSNSTESTDISKLSGWSSSYKLLQTQLRRKKVAQTRPVSSTKSKSVNQVVLGIKRNTEDSEDQSSEVDTRDSQDVDLKKLPEPFIETEASLSIIVDEYDPMRPNDYEVVKEKFREERDHERAERGDRHERTENRERTRDRDYDRGGERHRERDRERDRDRDRDYDRGRDRDRDRERDRDYPSRERSRERGRRRNGSDDEENYSSQTSRHRFSSGAAIAPPPSLMQQEIPIPPSEQWPVSSGDYMSSEKPNLGFSASPVASQIMARYGWKDGQGLGKQEQGINTCLQVEKTSKRGGKIINQDKETNKAPKEPEPVTNVLKNPSKVVVLRNMVGSGEVDDDLQPEVVEECAKYGEVVKVIIYEIPQGVPDEEAVRIFVEFQRVESAIKALVDLNGRFFGGRTVRGAFYNLDKFRRLDLMADL